ncbi:Ankyrin_repeat protein 1 [Hexamita inflata]|uniref:Ankyrin repeat protein 1 n=1 Tax=Hexamita inflata TaxID=28002 RepID=A0AA86QC09_9EUKA|nr:Ankyrin repeat protein 1 [Hexamita inflata]
MCMQKPDWFIAAQTGDMTNYKKYFSKYQSSYDKRESNPEQNIMTGWAAIHYAVSYGHVQMVTELLPTECQLTTNELNICKCAGFGPKSKLKIPSGTNVVQLAILMKQVECLKLILTFLQNNKFVFDSILHQKNAYNQTTYVIATMCAYQEAVDLIITNPRFLEEINDVLSGDFVPIFNVTAFGRILGIRALHQLQQNELYYQKINEQLLQRDQKYLSALDLSKLELNRERFPITDEEKLELQNITYEMTKTAFLFARTSKIQKLEGMTTAFLMGKPVREIFDDEFDTNVKQFDQQGESGFDEKLEYIKKIHSQQKAVVRGNRAGVE